MQGLGRDAFCVLVDGRTPRSRRIDVEHQRGVTRRCAWRKKPPSGHPFDDWTIASPKNETGRRTKIVFVKPLLVIDKHKRALTDPLGRATCARRQLLKLAKTQPGAFASNEMKSAFNSRTGERKSGAPPNGVVARVITDEGSRPRRDSLVECVVTAEVHRTIGVHVALQPFCHAPDRLRGARSNKTESHDGSIVATSAASTE